MFKIDIKIEYSIAFEYNYNINLHSDFYNSR